MKNIFATLIICLSFSSNSFSQNVTNTVLSTNFEYYSPNLNEHLFTFTTNFFEANPQNNTHSIEIIGDTLFVKMYYNIIGFWVPESDNQSIDTVTFDQALPATVHRIKMSTNVITYRDTAPYDEITVADVYYRIIDLDLSIIQNNFKNISIFPNPTSGKINISNDEAAFDKIIILNNLGQINAILYQNNEGIYNLQSLVSGMYYLQYYDTNNKRIGVSKLIKQDYIK